MWKKTRPGRSRARKEAHKVFKMKSGTLNGKKANQRARYMIYHVIKVLNLNDKQAKVA